MKYVFGINPVTELLKTDAHIKNLNILKSKKEKLAKQINIAEKKGINILFQDKDFFDKNAGQKLHQGIIAFCEDNVINEITEQDLYNSKNETITLLALDGITDPHNLGAVLRSADLFGVGAVLLPKDNSANINSTVFKSSSGAAFYVPVCKITNLTRTLKKLKDYGYWIYALDVNGEQILNKEKFSEKRIIVLGSEGKGLKRLVKQTCDITLKIPTTGNVDSLNASNAAAIILYELFTNHT